MSVRIAAVGDIHVSTDTCGRLAASLRGIGERADTLLIAGDLTQVGSDAEVDCLLRELAVVDVPIIAVLGNHDHHAGQPERVAELLTAAGVAVLEGTSTVVAAGGRTVGVAGVKGFGGGFPGAQASGFGEIEMKRFVRHTADAAERLERCLNELSTDFRVALLALLADRRDAGRRTGGHLCVHGELSAGRGDRSRRCRPRVARPRPPRV